MRPATCPSFGWATGTFPQGERPIRLLSVTVAILAPLKLRLVFSGRLSPGEYGVWEQGFELLGVDCEKGMEQAACFAQERFLWDFHRFRRLGLDRWRGRQLEKGQQAVDLPF